MRVILFLVTFLFALMSAMGLNAAEKTRLPTNRFMIGTWGFDENAQDEPHVKDASEAGIDYIISIGERNTRMLDLLKKYGMYAIVSGSAGISCGGGTTGKNAGSLSSRMTVEQAKEKVYCFTDHEATLFAYVVDEPNALDFPHLGKCIAAMRSSLPDGLDLFINLYPGYASKATGVGDSQLGTRTFREYIEQYCKYVPIDSVCYDYYMYTPNPNARESMWLQNYENLEIVSTECRKGNRKLFYVGQINASKESVRMSAGKVRFQVYTAMAYGCKSFIWACWSDSWWVHNVLNKDGSRNDLEYELLKDVNKDVHTLGKWYVQFDNVATHLVGFKNEGFSDWGLKSVKLLDAAGITGLKTTDGSPLAVGEMKTRSGDYSALFIVASDDPWDENPDEHKIVFKTRNKIRAVGPKGKVEITRKAGGEQSVMLKSNEAVMLITREPTK